MDRIKCIKSQCSIGYWQCMYIFPQDYHRPTGPVLSFLSGPHRFGWAEGLPYFKHCCGGWWIVNFNVSSSVLKICIKREQRRQLNILHIIILLKSPCQETCCIFGDDECFKPPFRKKWSHLDFCSMSDCWFINIWNKKKYGVLKWGDNHILSRISSTDWDCKFLVLHFIFEIKGCLGWLGIGGWWPYAEQDLFHPSIGLGQ